MLVSGFLLPYAEGTSDHDHFPYKMGLMLLVKLLELMGHTALIFAEAKNPVSNTKFLSQHQNVFKLLEGLDRSKLMQTGQGQHSNAMFIAVVIPHAENPVVFTYLVLIQIHTR